MSLPIRRPAGPAVKVVTAKAGDTFSVGPVTCRIMEDGSNTDNRIGAAEFVVPPHTAGPPQHYHLMHDETFLVQSGTLTFTQLKKDIVAHAGDYVVVPVKAPHTFRNDGDVEARFFNTFTPAYYVDYFRLLAEGAKESGKLDQETAVKAMERFATFLVERQELE